MITDHTKYRNFLKFLSVVGISISTYSYSYATEVNYTSSSVNSSYTTTLSMVEDIKESSLNKEDIIDVDKIIKDNAPYKILSIKKELVTDDFGVLNIIDVYMELPSKIDDDLIVSSSMNATGLIDSDEYLITYL